ncbi:MAG: hypothetical protein Q8Q69_04235, partial [Nitrosopumilaceae archaeon]|nr:hypothetical protein [Nitrosopumilaceae archaeon]
MSLIQQNTQKSITNKAKGLLWNEIVKNVGKGIYSVCDADTLFLFSDSFGRFYRLLARATVKNGNFACWEVCYNGKQFFVLPFAKTRDTASAQQIVDQFVQELNCLLPQHQKKLRQVLRKRADLCTLLATSDSDKSVRTSLSTNFPDASIAKNMIFSYLTVITSLREQLGRLVPEEHKLKVRIESLMSSICQTIYGHAVDMFETAMFESFTDDFKI